MVLLVAEQTRVQVTRATPTFRLAPASAVAAALFLLVASGAFLLQKMPQAPEPSAARSSDGRVGERNEYPLDFAYGEERPDPREEAWIRKTAAKAEASVRPPHPNVVDLIDQLGEVSEEGVGFH